MKFERLLNIFHVMRNLLPLLFLFPLCKSYSFRNTGLNSAYLLTSKALTGGCILLFAGDICNYSVYCVCRKSLRVPNPWPGYRRALCSWWGVITEAFQVPIVNVFKKIKFPQENLYLSWKCPELKKKEGQNVAASLICRSFYSNFILHF